MERKLH